MEVLRDCLPSSVRQTLKDLPESLDETYERILKEIKRPNRAHALRVLQCLVVAIRPLRVAELVEVLAVDFNDTEGIPRLKPDWRWEEQEIALQSACSSLIAIVEAGGSRLVQFSHFSVKEFLTSPRLATGGGEVSNYHIDSGPAHAILAQVCVGVLLQTQVDIDGHTLKEDGLAQYAAQHWTTHAQSGEVSSRLHNGMKHLFDANKPYFKVWLKLCDIDTRPKDDAIFYWFASDDKSPASPLYYAALCGFYDIVEHLIAKHPQDVDTNGGYYMRPLVAALAGEHFNTAALLCHKGADLHVRGRHKSALLHLAAFYGNLELVRNLIQYDPADINVRNSGGGTPLLWASGGRFFKDGSVLRFLLEHGADINMPNHIGRTPLHWASINGALDVVRLLLEHGADVEAREDNGRTALQEAAERKHYKIVELLQENGAK